MPGLLFSTDGLHNQMGLVETDTPFTFLPPWSQSSKPNQSSLQQPRQECYCWYCYHTFALPGQLTPLVAIAPGVRSPREFWLPQI